MPSKKKKYNSRFPPARIKKIMQTDDDVGKVAAAVPVIISRALELFIESLILKTNETTVARNAKTLTTSHIKQTIEGEKKFDFLRELVSTIPDHQTEDDGGENSGHVEPKKRGPKGPRKPRDGTSSRKRRDRKSSSESSEANANDDEETETDEEDNNGTASAYTSPETTCPIPFQSPEVTSPSTSLQFTSPGMPPPMGMPMGSPGIPAHPAMQMTPPGMSGPSTSLQMPPSAYPLSPHIPPSAAAHTLPPPLPFNCFPNPLMSQVQGMSIPSSSGVMPRHPQHPVEDDDYDT